MKIKGVIKTQKRVFAEKQECYGSTRVIRDMFEIKLSERAIQTKDEYSETLLHELMHLWLYILLPVRVHRLSPNQQEKFIAGWAKTVAAGLRGGQSD